MLPLTGYFEGLFDRIKPPKDRRDLAKTLPDTVRDHLVMSDRLETMSDGTATRLAGSYGRKTGVDDIKDVDILVFVARHYANEPPEVVLDALAEALKDLEVVGYGKGDVKTRRKNRRSHHVEFSKDGEESFHIDCVPVVRSGDDPSATLRIPDREWLAWDDTRPLGYSDLLTRLNQANDGKVLRTIRMLKRIRNHHLRKSLPRPKSYWLEAKVFELWNSGRLSSEQNWADLTYDLLKKLRSDCPSSRLVIFDPGLGRDLTATWEQAEYDEFVQLLDEVIGYLDPIEDVSDSETAVAAWKKVFGSDAFELSDDARKAADAAKALVGAAKITTAGVVVPSSAPKGTISQQHRFWGER